MVLWLLYLAKAEKGDKECSPENVDATCLSQYGARILPAVNAGRKGKITQSYLLLLRCNVPHRRLGGPH